MRGLCSNAALPCAKAAATWMKHYLGYSPVTCPSCQGQCWYCSQRGEEREQLAEKIDRADKSVEKIARENEACRRLVKMPGVGPVTATAIIATIGNGAAFRKGRDFAAWLGVVPEEHSTGGEQTLWKIPQRGNQYLRRLFVQGREPNAAPDQAVVRFKCLAAAHGANPSKHHSRCAGNKCARMA